MGGNEKQSYIWFSFIHCDHLCCCCCYPPGIEQIKPELECLYQATDSLCISCDVGLSVLGMSKKTNENRFDFETKRKKIDTHWTFDRKVLFFLVLLLLFFLIILFLYDDRREFRPLSELWIFQLNGSFFFTFFEFFLQKLT